MTEITVTEGMIVLVLAWGNDTYCTSGEVALPRNINSLSLIIVERHIMWCRCWWKCTWELVDVTFWSRHEIETTGGLRGENKVKNGHLPMLPEWTRKMQYDFQTAPRPSWDLWSCIESEITQHAFLPHAFFELGRTPQVNYLKCLIFFMLNVMHCGHKND